MTTLDNLRKTAKRWLKAIRAGDRDALARLQRAVPNASAQPGLRELQHALARERGFESWIALVNAHHTATMDSPSELVRDLLAAYETGESAALLRLRTRYGSAFTVEQLRAGIRRRVDGLPEADASTGVLDLRRARLLVAHEYGFDSWTELENARAALGGPPIPADDVPLVLPLDFSTAMIQPVEIRAGLPVRLHDGTLTDTTSVWSMLTACHDGDLERVHAQISACPSLIVCDYNYMTPLHLAVREGRTGLVRDLCGRGAANPNYVTYPYRESLVTVAEDRGHEAIAKLLQDAYEAADRSRREDETGEILYDLDDGQRRFQKLLNTDAPADVERLLEARPALAQNPFAFWSEGVLMMPAKLGHLKMIELLMRYGARVPDMSKWGAWYYLWHDDIASFLLDRDMDPNHTNCHHTTVLHDMAYKGDLRKAALLLDHGADVNAIDREFQSTPLGLASRWGHRAMVALLLERGADPNVCGASWATPVEWARKKGHRDLDADLRRAGARG